MSIDWDRWRERGCHSHADFYWKVGSGLSYPLSQFDHVYRPENVPAFLEAVKKREKVLSGFGHRVYKTVSYTLQQLQAAANFMMQSDPRSFIVRKTADEVFKMYAYLLQFLDIRSDRYK